MFELVVDWFWKSEFASQSIFKLRNIFAVLETIQIISHWSCYSQQTLFGSWKKVESKQTTKPNISCCTTSYLFAMFNVNTGMHQQLKFEIIDLSIRLSQMFQPNCTILIETTPKTLKTGIYNTAIGFSRTQSQKQIKHIYFGIIASVEWIFSHYSFSSVFTKVGIIYYC